jgi:hypothetical protein
MNIMHLSNLSHLICSYKPNMTFLPLFLIVASMWPFECQAGSGLVFDKVEKTENDKYIKSTFRIENVAGKSTLSADFTVLKELNYRISVEFDLQIV